MSIDQDAGVAISRVERASGLEYDCVKCKDWGTDEKLELCPAGCEAARKFARIQAAARKRYWLRWCNGQPAAGILTGRDEAEWCATQPGAVGSLSGKLVWHVEDHGNRREFTLIPLTDEQLAAWYTDQGILPSS